MILFLKFIILILIIIIPSYIGICKARVFKNREIELKEFKVALRNV